MYHAIYVDRRDAESAEPESAIGEAETLDIAFAQIAEYFGRVPTSLAHAESAFVRDTDTGEIHPFNMEAEQ